MRLPGTEQWNVEAVGDLVRFELAFAQSAQEIQSIVDAADGDRQPKDGRLGVSEADFAIGRAAELAFAMGNPQRGALICTLITGADRPRTPMQLAFFSAVGALIGTVKVSLHPWGAMITVPDHERTIKLSWPLDDSSYASSLMRAFLPAAAASGPVSETIGDLFNRHSDFVKPQTIAAVLRSEECSPFLTVSFGEPRANISPTRYLESLRAIESMEDRYTNRLAMMRSDTYHWQAMKPKGSLIDWPLLCTWVAHLRYEAPGFTVQEIPTLSEGALFMRWLALELQQFILPKQ